MRIIVEKAVFRSPPNPLTLISLFDMAMSGRHRIEPEELDAPEYLAWASVQDARTQEFCQEAIDQSIRAAAAEPSRFEIIVTAQAASEWDVNPPRLTLEDARAFLQRPFRILLEDSEADRHFFSCMADARQRDFLSRFLKEGWLVFENGGGITNIPKRINAFSDEVPAFRLKLWVMFDSDALCHHEPSDQSKTVHKLCAENRIPHRQLLRRSIENYLTLNALQGWAYNDLAHQEVRRPIYNAFRQLETIQRAFFNMKRGFDADSERHKISPGAQELYRKVTDDLRKALVRGFGDLISRLFQDGSVREADLRVEGVWSEMNPVISEVIARIR